MRSISNAGTGINFHYGQLNTYKDIISTNNTLGGIVVYDSGDDENFSDVVVSNNGTFGFFLDFAGTGIFSNMLATNNGGIGLNFGDSYFNRFFAHNIAAFNNGGDGIYFGSLYNGVINRAFSSNNGGNGISIKWDSNSIFSQLVTSNNNGYSLVQDSSDGTVFSNNLLIGNNSNPLCNVVGGTSPGINNSCISAANLITNIDANNSFVGPLSNNDLKNLSNNLGLGAFASIFDWTNFDYPFRVWGRPSGALNVGARGRCSSGNCQIWDVALKITDTAFRHRALDGLTPLNLFDEQLCPAAFSGNRAIFNSQSDSFEILDDGIGNENIHCDSSETGCYTKTFLVDAMEIPGDRMGNDDGLCESNETCIALPNLSFYNGHGDPNLKSCLFSNGLVTGVHMKFYPYNGF